MTQLPPKLPWPPEAPEPKEQPLFRTEAVQGQVAGLHGSIILMPGSGSRWVALAALGLTLALVALLALGSYTRRATVVGVLQPSEGLIRVSAPQAGVVVERPVSQGQDVAKGQVLLVLSTDRPGPDARNFQGDVAANLEARRRSLEEDRRRAEAAERVEAEQLRRRIASLRSELGQLARQTENQNTRLRLSGDSLRRYEGLYKNDYISRDELQLRQADEVEQRNRVQVLNREALAVERDLAANERELGSMAERYANLRAEGERAILALRQEATELEARRRIVVVAPAAGRVSLLQADIGQTVEPMRVLAHLTPAGAPLVARLYAPSRTAGFTQPGAPVLLRYDAFPYQKFGQHQGLVSSVSTSAVSAAEMDGGSSGAAPAGGRGADDSLFAITVTLPAQTIGNNAQPLQSGMRLEADLLQEKRRLYEWMLEPLFSATRRMETP